ncbi:hypothetical protein [Microbulbifer sp. SSSA005]|uniref:hypothetical protein n=1 Tax=unclassified Microbulbifer TaxID=2619833 RepID=UPI00403A513C
MNTLEDIEKTLSESTSIRRLDISGKELKTSKLTEFLNRCRSDLNDVKYLRIDLSELEKIPDEIFTLKNLQEICLVGKKIEGLKGLSLPAQITSFTLNCDSIDELPGFLYTNTCKRILIKCKNLKKTCKDLIRLPERDTRFTIEIDNLLELPPIEITSSVQSFQLKSKALSHIDFNFFRNIVVGSLTVDCDKLKSIKNINATDHVKYFNLYTTQPLDFSQWSISDTIDTLKIKTCSLKLPELTQATQLRSLHIEGVSGEITQDIGNCSNLTELSIRNSTISSISPYIEQCQNLKSISIDGGLDFFPECISKLRKLNSLRLTNNKISQIDIDWSALIDLSYLSLRNNNTVFSSLAFVSDLPNLSKLNIDGNTLENRYVLLHRKKIPIEQSYSIFSSAKGSIEYLLGFCSALAKTRLSEQNKRRLLDFVWEHGSDINLLLQDPELLTLALSVQFKPIKTKLIDYVQTFVKSHSGLELLSKESVLYIEGKPNTTLKKLKEKVSTIGYGFSKHLDENVTHVIIGKSPSNPKVFDSDRFVYLTENDVFSLESQQNPKFLEQQVQQGDTSALDAVNDLLSNVEPVNVKIGLQMLETGGVPADILETVLMIAKSNPDSKVRAQAKKVLVEQGPSEWALLIDDKQLFKNLNESVKEQDINNKLKKIEKTAGFDSAATLSLALYKRYKKGLRFLIEKRSMNERWLQRMYTLLMEGEHFAFSTGLGYKNWKNTRPEDVTLFPHRANYSFPKDVLKWHTVTSVNLHNTKLTSLPKELVLFKDLKKLDLSANYLASLGSQIEELEKIEELDLSFNNFKKFPSNITKLPRLRKVDLRHCSIDYDQKPLTIPKTVKNAIPDCEILV